MCSSAQFPDYATTESFAEAASSKAPEAVHYYGNCNSKNSKSYAQVRRVLCCCVVACVCVPCVFVVGVALSGVV